MALYDEESMVKLIWLMHVEASIYQMLLVCKETREIIRL